MNDLKYFGAHLSLSFQTHVVRKILRKRFYFPSALVVCVSHPRFENRLACDCLCHFVKKKCGVIFGGDLKSCRRENSNCDGDIPFLQTFQWAGRDVIRWNLHNSSLLSFSLFTCSFVSPSLPWILKNCTFMRSAQGTDESHHLPEMTIVVVFVQTM